MIRGILFDLGETLLNFGRVDVRACFDEGARRAWQHLDERGRPVPDIDRYVRHQKWAIRRHYVFSRFGTKELDVLKLLVRSHRRYGIDLSRAEALALTECFYAPLGRAGVVEPQARELLEGFRRHGRRTALVSNTFIPGEVLDAHLHREGLRDLLEARIYSCQVGRRKPNRRIYDAALESLGLTGPTCLFVGDNFKCDVVGPARLGMYTVHKHPDGAARRTVHPTGGRPAPTACIRALAELPEVLDQIESSDSP